MKKLATVKLVGEPIFLFINYTLESASITRFISRERDKILVFSLFLQISKKNSCTGTS